MRKIAIELFIVLVAASCGGGEGARDAGDEEYSYPEMCYAHPSTCNTGGGGIDPYDCCRPPKVCCNLCFPATRCGSRTDCLEECPLTIPCEGVPEQENLSCYFFPEDFQGKAYCPVNENPGPMFPVSCTGECPTGVECPLPVERFPAETYGEVALCCPEGWHCEVVDVYNLPMCAAP